MTRSHTDREYESRLQQLRDSLLKMAGRVEVMIGDSVRAIVERDADLARSTIAADAAVNQCEIEVDKLAMLILARWQPMASDLRFITFALKMVTDIERIGDLAVNIAERAVDLASSAPLARPYVDTPRMGELVRSMVRDAIDAFVRGDANAAREVIRCDDQVDELYVAVFQDILDIMRHDPDTLSTGIHVQSVAKWLERIGDHATNLAEQVIFMNEGMDVRHHGKLPTSKK